MSDDKLERKLASYFDGQKATVKQVFIGRGGTSLDEICRAMIDIGMILEEDLDQGIYVARVTGGRRKPYGPIIAATPRKGGVDVAAIVVRGKKEPAVEAMGMFEDALNGNPPKPKPKRFGLKLLLLLVLISVVLAACTYYCFFPQFVIPAQAATAEYNSAVKEFNAVVPRYNSVASGVAVDNVRGLVPQAKELKTQGMDYVSVCRSVIGGNRADKIEKDASTVRGMAKELSSEISVLEAINNPNEEWVISKLERVEGIEQINAVTNENDPNKMLGAEGGYSSCTYFTTGLLGQDVVKGATPVEKGVDGGGAVEVYPTLADAKARCEYLAGFDDSVLYSGSYALIGTMVVRTSCLLADEAQYALTNGIVASMMQS